MTNDKAKEIKSRLLIKEKIKKNLFLKRRLITNNLLNFFPFVFFFII